MYRLYIANQNYSSWSLRPWVLMRTLNIPFESIKIPFGAENKHVFEKISPTSRFPCLIEGDTTVWDSLAIIEYLAEQHPDVWPNQTQVRAFARCITAEMHAGFNALREICSMNCGIRVKLKHFSPALNKDIKRIDALWCEGLERFGGPYLAGNTFTAADAFYAPVVFRVQTYGISLSPVANAYVTRMLELPAIQEWYNAALTETWRDRRHEPDFATIGGSLLQDFRLS